MSTLNFTSPADGSSGYGPPPAWTQIQSEYPEETFDHNAFIAAQRSYGDTHVAAKEAKRQKRKKMKKKQDAKAAKEEAKAGAKDEQTKGTVDESPQEGKDSANARKYKRRQRQAAKSYVLCLTLDKRQALTAGIEVPRPMARRRRTSMASKAAATPRRLHLRSGDRYRSQAYRRRHHAASLRQYRRHR